MINNRLQAYEFISWRAIHTERGGGRQAEVGRGKPLSGFPLQVKL